MSNVSIGGRGGNPVPSTTLVATDQVTIFGNGSGENPLSTLGGSGGPIVNVPNGFTLQHIQPGAAITFNDAPFNFSLASAGKNIFSNAGRSLAQVIGLALPAGAAGFETGITFQISGVLTLTAAQWDAVKDGASGGLSPNATYYLSVGFGGNLTTIPGGPRLGYAISPTQLVVEIGGQPSYVVGTAEAGLVVGMPSLLDEPTGIIGAINGGTASQSCAVGITASIQNGTAAVALDGEVVELTTGQWDAVTGQSGGLTPGQPYWLAAVTRGHVVVSTAPVATGTFQILVGVANSSTAMLVKTGQPVGPHA